MSVYKGVQFITPVLHSRFFTPVFPGEEYIPFVPGMVLVYLSVYVLPLIMLMLVPSRFHVRRFVRIFCVAAAVHALFFVILPIQYVLRPDLDAQVATPLLDLVRAIYTVDAPYNNFPSMHVSFAFLSYFCMRFSRPKISPVFLLAAALIAVSTLLVKQHYIIDVAGAIVLAYGLNHIYLEDGIATEAEKINSLT